MKPYVIVFNRISLDRRIGFGSGHVDMGTYYTLAASWNADAMLSGSNTMLQTSPLEQMPDPDTFEKAYSQQNGKKARGRYSVQQLPHRGHELGWSYGRKGNFDSQTIRCPAGD